MVKQLCPDSHRGVSSSYRAKLARTCPLVNPALLAQTNYKHTKGGKQPPETALNEHTIDQCLNKPISTWTCGLLLKPYAVQLSGKPCVLLSCCPVRVSKQASSAASLASWLNSQALDRGAAHRKSTTKANRSSLPSYKSRRSFGLSSVFPSVSRHVGPNPDVEIIRADAAAEFRESLLPLSRITVKTHKIACITSGLAFDERLSVN